MARRGRRRKALSTALLTGRIGIRIACYVLLAFLAVAAFHRAYTFGYSVFHSNPMSGAPGKDVAVTIMEDMTTRDIGQLLQRKGLIRDANVFAVQANIYNYKLYPGTYVLNTAQDITDMIGVMSVEPETQADGTVIPTQASGGGQ